MLYKFISNTHLYLIILGKSHHIEFQGTEHRGSQQQQQFSPSSGTGYQLTESQKRQRTGSVYADNVSPTGSMQGERDNNKSMGEVGE